MNKLVNIFKRKSLNSKFLDIQNLNIDIRQFRALLDLSLFLSPKWPKICLLIEFRTLIITPLGFSTLISLFVPGQIGGQLGKYLVLAHI